MSVKSTTMIVTVMIIIITIIMVLHQKFVSTLLEVMSVFVHLATPSVMSHIVVYVSCADLNAALSFGY